MNTSAFAETMNPFPEDQYPGINLELRPPGTQNYTQVPQQQPARQASPFPGPGGEQLPQVPNYGYYPHPAPFMPQGPPFGYQGAPQQYLPAHTNPYYPLCHTKLIIHQDILKCTHPRRRSNSSRNRMTRLSEESTVGSKPLPRT